jgi:hypothetical protein
MLVLITSVSSFLPVSIKILPSKRAVIALIPTFITIGFTFSINSLIVSGA